ncbi:PACE efflux transporter [Pleomorphomonas oryzae]|uniref:PACE efflux transporter n=1 Tax=Pleomorphomonas oryzae TaxID=261934 RepID=UPI00041E9E3B|nr:PACE efflux transporter [Pleomorphomonas oryzae]
MRSVSDRIRHAISFEAIGLLLVTPMGALVFDLPMQEMGVVSVVSAMIATAWNLIYNYLFDLAMTRTLGTTAKGGVLRVFHAVLFEAGLLCVLLPFIAVYLGISLWQALAMDVSFALFYMAYAFVFNWGYDRVFPLPEWQTQA